MTTTETKRSKREIPTRAIGLITAGTFFLIPLVFEFNDLSEAGHRMFAIFLLAIVLWVTEAIPLYATAVLIIILEILMVSDQALVGLPAAFEPREFRDYFAALADPVLMLFLGGFFLAMGASKFRLDRAMAATLLRPFGDNPARIMLGLMLITGGFSMFMSNTATTATMMAVVLPVVAALAPEDRLRTGMVLAIPIAANIGGIGTPVGTPPNAIAIGQLAASGIPVSFGKWMVMAVPAAAALLLITWWLLRRLFPSNTTTLTLNLEAEFDKTREARIFYAVFALTVVLWLTESFHGISSSIVGFIPVVVLLATQVFKDKDIQNVQWHVLWLVAGGIALGRGVADSGLDSWLIGLISWENIGPAVIAAAFAVVALILSTVISNSASANLLVPIGLSLAAGTAVDLDPLIVGFVIAIGASLAMALPISTPPNAIAYSSGMIKTGDMARAGLVVGLIGLVLFLVVSPAIWSVLGIA
ncbi:MAG: DASS family sodium-coupled anion symporter [Acidimicrobiia bacterium]|nr:DASS family sodium-coupled anion symporter [Acidimicrobiia bacterium]